MASSSLPDVYSDVDMFNRVDQLIIERMANHLRGPRVLTMGYADDCWPDVALERGFSVSIVEGLASNVAQAEAKYAGNEKVSINHCLFEDLDPEIKFDTVVLGNIIELYEDPKTLFQLVEKFLAPNGIIILTTPNANSLHRRIGTYLGFEESCDTLNERSIKTGCHHIYNMNSLRKAFNDYGFKILDLRGLFLKPLSTQQMNDWNEELLNAFMLAGDEVSGDLCKQLVAIAKMP